MRFVVILSLLFCINEIFGGIKQGEWRWRNDDDSESDATPIAAVNTPFTLDNYNNIRLRVEVYNDDLVTKDGIIALFYSTSSSAGSGTWTQITTNASTNAFALSLSNNFADEDAASSDLLSETLGNSRSSNGKMYETSDTQSISVLDSTSEEHEYCIKATLNAATSTQYYFAIRFFSGSSVLKGYSTLPSLTTGGALPVELTYFTAKIKKGKVSLSWETATEVNNYGFEIQRTTPGFVTSSFGRREMGGDDLHFLHSTNDSWETLAFIKGHGNSNSPKYYSFIDKDAPSGELQYRLKQIDFDGTFEYSDIVEITNNINYEFDLSQNYPNPFNPYTNIEFTLPQAGLVTLNIYNTLGEKVAELLNVNLEAGFRTVPFNAGSLPSGVYIYRIEAGSFVQSKKMQLLK